jgi:glutathione synthase/RimK-type ligase-like ATP-grasp enzyme
MIFQQRIAKKVELRITVVREEVFTAEIHSQATPQAAVDWRRYPKPPVPHFPHKLSSSIAEKCLKLNARLGLEFSTIDMAITPEGKHVFFEINPNGQWAWIESLTGLPISMAVAQALAEH